MAPQISQQLRERIVFWRYQQLKTASQIAELTGCSEQTVFNILCFYRDFGQVNNPYKRQKGLPRTLNPGDLNYISSILEANPTLYLDEIQQRLFEARDCDVSIAAICRAVGRLELTHKKVAREALERDELVRATWIAEYGDVPMEACIWLDESSISVETGMPLAVVHVCGERLSSEDKDFRCSLR